MVRKEETQKNALNFKIIIRYKHTRRPIHQLRLIIKRNQAAIAKLLKKNLEGQRPD